LSVIVIFFQDFDLPSLLVIQKYFPMFSEQKRWLPRYVQQSNTVAGRRGCSPVGEYDEEPMIKPGQSAE